VIVHALLDDAGQGLAEYALVLGFVAVLCIGAVSFLGGRLTSQIQSISDVFP
jgi:Flp pilus assembly pilin Flp